MRKKHSNRYLVVFCLLISLTFSGCAALVAGGAVGAGVGATYAYVQGWLERDYEVTLDQAHRASLSAIRNLEMNVEEEIRGVGSSRIKAKKGDQSHWINLTTKGKRLTTVSVRSGILGDEAASRTIHQEIERNL
jgi:uncharacterized protein YceK